MSARREEAAGALLIALAGALALGLAAYHFGAGHLRPEQPLPGHAWKHSVAYRAHRQEAGL